MDLAGRIRPSVIVTQQLISVVVIVIKSLVSADLKSAFDFFHHHHLDQSLDEMQAVMANDLIHVVQTHYPDSEDELLSFGLHRLSVCLRCVDWPIGQLVGSLGPPVGTLS